MLVLTRKKNDSLIINDNIEIIILAVDGDQIKIGIKAPKEVPILRKEIVINTENENLSAINKNIDLKKFLKENG
jgi:carbon storage regulator